MLWDVEMTELAESLRVEYVGPGVDTASACRASLSIGHAPSCMGCYPGGVWSGASRYVMRFPGWAYGLCGPFMAYQDCVSHK